MKTCWLCSIVEGTKPASVVFSTGGELAFLDISPVNRGHTLVVPRRHVATFTQLNTEEMCSLALAVQRVATELKKKLPGCAGVTLSLADGEGAGQDVPHAHFHVIPRYLSDDFGWRRLGRPSDRATLDSLAAEMRSAE